jgi:hypothetical protein
MYNIRMFSEKSPLVGIIEPSQYTYIAGICANDLEDLLVSVKFFIAMPPRDGINVIRFIEDLEKDIGKFPILLRNIIPEP